MEHSNERRKDTQRPSLTPQTPAGRFTDFFPYRFEFFGIGHLQAVAKVCDAAELAQLPFVIVFRMTGEESGLCVVGFQRRPADADEMSMLTELANVLASKFASRLAEDTGAQLELSPPEAVATEQPRFRYIGACLKTARPSTVALRAYEFNRPGCARESVRLAFLPSTQGGTT